MRGHVLNFEGDDITAAQLAVDGQIENCQIPGLSRGLQLGSDRSNVLRTKGRLGSNQFAFVPRLASSVLEIVLVVFHDHTDRLCGSFAGLGSARY